MKRWLLFGVLIAVASASLALFYWWWFVAVKPLEEPAPLVFREGGSADEQLQFLDGNFRIVKRVGDLPRPVLDSLTEEKGGRLTMADPGKRFEATDVIRDPALPRKRLIFAGVANDKIFLHYEEGGIAHVFILAFLRLHPDGRIEPVLRSFCGPAADLESLRREIRSGDCSQGVPRQMR